MPYYNYACNTCGHEFEDFKTIASRLDVECPKCGGQVRMLVSRVVSEPNLHIFQPFVHEDLCDTPVLVKSKAHYKELCKKHGCYAKHVFGEGWNISEI